MYVTTHKGFIRKNVYVHFKRFQGNVQYEWKKFVENKNGRGFWSSKRISVRKQKAVKNCINLCFRSIHNKTIEYLTFNNNENTVYREITWYLLKDIRSIAIIWLGGFIHWYSSSTADIVITSLLDPTSHRNACLALQTQPKSSGQGCLRPWGGDEGWGVAQAAIWHGAKLPSKYLFSAHRQILLSVLSGGTSFCFEQCSESRLISAYAKNMCRLSAYPSFHKTLTSPTLGFREHERKGHRKNVRAGRWGIRLWNASFWKWLHRLSSYICLQQDYIWWWGLASVSHGLGRGSRIHTLFYGTIGYWWILGMR